MIQGSRACPKGKKRENGVFGKMGTLAYVAVKDLNSLLGGVWKKKVEQRADEP